MLGITGNLNFRERIGTWVYFGNMFKEDFSLLNILSYDNLYFMKLVSEVNMRFEIWQVKNLTILNFILVSWNIMSLLTRFHRYTFTRIYKNFVDGEFV